MWRILEERCAFQDGQGAKVFTQEVQLPCGRRVDDYTRIELPSFVTVLAFDLSGHALALDQYKHGVGQRALTLPGGRIEPGEAPEAAARRELFEETGYVAGCVRPMSTLVLHGNQRIARAHHILAVACERWGDAAGDPLEEATLVSLSLERLREAFIGDRFPIASHAAAIGRYFAERHRP